MLKAALAKIAHGLLTGIGFAIAIGAAFYGYYQWQMSQLEEKTGLSMTFKQYSPDSGLAITEHRAQRAEVNSAFLGAISNGGQDTWQNVEVLVELFDKQNTFVDKCSGYMDGSIGPGEKRNFKVSCSGCRDVSQPLVYDHYTIVIADANYSPKETRSN